MLRPLVLRLYVRDAAASIREEALLRLVRGSVPVPEVLHAEPDAAQLGWPFAAITWIEGTPMPVAVESGERDAVEAATVAGRTLAAIGRHRFSGSGFFGPDLGIEQPLGWRMGVVAEIERCLFVEAGGERLGAPSAARLHELVSAHGPLLAELPETAALVHADYRPANILLRGAPAPGRSPACWTGSGRAPARRCSMLPPWCGGRRWAAAQHRGNGRRWSGCWTS